jgi:hypothetical protein
MSTCPVEPVPEQLVSRSEQGGISSKPVQLRQNQAIGKMFRIGGSRRALKVMRFKYSSRYSPVSYRKYINRAVWPCACRPTVTVQTGAMKNQALIKVLRYNFLAAPSRFGNFVRNGLRVPVVAPAGSEPWGWQLLRFTNITFSEALYRRPGVRSNAAGHVDRKVDNKEATVRDVAIQGSAFGFAVGAPFAVYPFGEGTGLFDSPVQGNSKPRWRAAVMQKKGRGSQ